MKLNDIATVWSEIFAAHADDTQQALRGRAAVLERYMGAVLGYLTEAVRDRHLAEDLAQDFAYRFLKGDFRTADPASGKFRGFLKTILRNQVIDHFRKKRLAPVAIEEHLIADNRANEAEELDSMFRENWRREILRQTWMKLNESGSESGQRFFIILQTRTQFPDLSSTELAEVLSDRLGTQVNSDWVRQNLKRARERFTALLRSEIALTLDTGDMSEVNQELVELDLKKYCD
jgi:RNA polymerase sigma-70 factor (ECF subfamily)